MGKWLQRVLFCCAGTLGASIAAQGQATNTFPSTGNVGIGTTAPAAPLSVSNGNQTIYVNPADSSVGGAITGYEFNIMALDQAYPWSNEGGHIRLGGSTRGDGAINAIQFLQNGSERMRINNGGNVGIGTTTPTATLTTYTGVSGLPSPSMIVTKNYAGGGDNVPAAEIVGTDSGIANTGLYITQKGSGGFGGTNGFVWEAVSNGNPVMLQAFNGNVGVGTTSPAYKLDVAGQIHTAAGVVYPDGNVQSVAWTGSLCGGDYAESINVSDDRRKYEPGDVLVIDPDAEGKFLKSAQPYATTVAGIYSTKPGVVGRRQTTAKSPDEIPMAVVGIVPTKVTTENGAIRAGDLLVTSSTPGYAMKGTDRSQMIGSIVGKAMGALASGTGMIEVLVSLQ